VEQADPLARLVHAKTAGNPFFTIQFLHVLADEGLLAFDHGRVRWSWDLGGIDAKRYTDNVVDLLAGNLTRLPLDTQDALRLLACLGNIADVAMLAMLLGKPEQQVQAALWEALGQQLIDRFERSYKFVHDRIQEAAYTLIPENSRAEVHLAIGRLFLAHTPLEKRDEAIFEIVNQLNRGALLIAPHDEREHLAELNLAAGKRAKASSACASALTYLTAGAALLPEDAWERRHDLIFPLELDRAQCEFLTGELATAEQRLSALSSRAADTGELATVACLRMDLYTVLGQSSRAVAVCLEYLQRPGIEWLPDPTADSARLAYERIWSMLGDRTIEDLIRLPVMTDTVSLATLNVLTTVLSPAMSTSENLVCLVVREAVSLSLDRGNSDGSCVPYVTLGMIAGLRFGNYAAGHRFGQLAYDLLERQGLSRFQARTYVSFARNIVPWTKYLRMSRKLLQQGFDAANAVGDVMFAAYSRMHLNANLLAAGDPLETVQREAEYGLEFAHEAQFGLVIDVIKTQLRLIRTLRGFAPKFGSLNDEGFDESKSEDNLASDSSLALRGCKYWILALQARYLAGDYVPALAALSSAEPLLWLTPSYFETTEFHFYGALSRAAAWDSASSDQRQQHFEALTAHHRQLEIWTEHCPENFENRAALVGAEIARIEGRGLDAEHLYEHAIHSAHTHGFVHNEALANEVAACFYAARGFEKISHTYLRDARYCYRRWGADGKVAQLDDLYPDLGQEEQTAGSSSTIRAPLQYLDLATVMKVSQAMSGEMVLERLIDTLMRTAIEHAGAERGLLILEKGQVYRIEAEATTHGNAVSASILQAGITAADLPESVFHYVVRTKETILLHDASAANAFSGDIYISSHHARSILCLPLLKQTRLIGVLYLENNLAAHVFSPAPMSVLNLLASEAAISLENTRLYRDLQEREARVRRLVSANIIGIFIWDGDGRIVDANEAFLRVVAYSRDDLEAGRLRWRDLTPAQWREADDRRMKALAASGTAPPYEKELFRKDGGRVPVLVGAANFEGAGDEGVGFVLDLTDRKRADEAVRESERRYREVQMELAHAGRVATIRQLSASIAHEVNQPIGAAITNANVGLHWLGVSPPDLEKVRQAVGRTVRNLNRAGEVLERIHGFVKKAPPRKESLAINEAIHEVIGLVRSEVVENGISLGTRLAEGLPLIEGDRVQLQQVILNLIVNAIEAMTGVREGARDLLIITSRVESEGILVEVRDSGPPQHRL
jgi:PAS domain S-box-containing protein